ncbi:hypothetical protein [Anaeromyxobacter paludicola]|uniref:Uncharacterized protein n=1 Tax=Anaeromyxobacter paludicola TaxID=2918171 RepID=A0ABN6N8Z9_9BACT|nr:hypothetical protein [Anaeromyxobacter paludicola]BDG09714.1 hypothetical protein AMPC_28270 [Anaeromyxobacter paludicola]
MARAKSRAEKLFSAAVLRRTFELRGDEHRQGFQFVYAGVLRDLELEAQEVEEYLASHREQVDDAIGRGKP